MEETEFEERNVKGWLPSSAGADHIASDANFSFLKSSGVYFYDRALAMPPVETDVPLPSLPTISTISGGQSP